MPADAEDANPHWLRPVALAALTALLVVVCGAVAAPFLPALTWAIALAILAWPVNSRLARHTGLATLSAFAMTAVVGCILVGAALFVAYQLAREVSAVAESGKDKSSGQLIDETTSRSETLGQAVAWASQAGLDFEGQAREIAGEAGKAAGDLARGSARAVVQLAMTLFLLFYLLKDRESLLQATRKRLPLSHGEADQVLTRTADAVYAILRANGTVCLIDTALGTLVFSAVGLPAPALLAAMVFVLSLVPPFGAALVWLPASAYMGLTGHGTASLVILAYGVLTWALVDNVLYARLAGGRAGLHPAVALIAVQGGLTAFGAAGLVLGPVLVVLTATLLDVWHDRQGSQSRPVEYG